jgi:hypothetical protein
MRRTGSIPTIAFALVALLIAGCGGGDSLPTGGRGGSGGDPSGNPPPSGGPFLALAGARVADYALSVERVAEAQGILYRVEFRALDWEVEFDLETWRVPGEVTAASLTSDELVPEGGLELRELVVDGRRLGTSGTSGGAFDPCQGHDGDEDLDDRWRRQGLVWGRMTRLDQLAEGDFSVRGTDEDCRRVEATFAFRAPVR